MNLRKSCLAFLDLNKTTCDFLLNNQHARHGHKYTDLQTTAVWVFRYKIISDMLAFDSNSLYWNGLNSDAEMGFCWWQQNMLLLYGLCDPEKKLETRIVMCRVCTYVYRIISQYSSGSVPLYPKTASCTQPWRGSKIETKYSSSKSLGHSGGPEWVTETLVKVEKYKGGEWVHI